MKNKIVKALLSTCLITALSLSVCACAFPSSVKDIFNKQEEDETDEDADADDADDEDDNSGKDSGDNLDGEELTAFTDNIGTPEINFPSIEQPAPGPSEGPDYVIGTGYEKYYDDADIGERSECIYTAYADYIYIVSSGYDLLQESLDEFNAQNMLSIENGFNGFGDLYMQDSTMGEMGLFDEYEVSVSRDDSEVFSITAISCNYLGGAHPSTYVYGISYNTETGEEISLKDYVTDYDELKNIVIDGLTEINYDEHAGLFWDNWDEVVCDAFDNESLCWVATDDGLSIWFNQYDIASYAEGIISMDVSVQDYPELFSENYRPAEETAPGKETVSIDDYGTKLLNVTGMELIDGVGTITFDECREIYENSDYVKPKYYSYEEPDGADINGYVAAVDQENNYTLECFFYPEYEDDPESASVIGELNYINDSCAICVSVDYYDRSSVSYEVINYESQTDVFFENIEDMLKFFFLYGDV